MLPAQQQRTLYLLPPSASVAERLRVTWDQRECLLAVAAPPVAAPGH